MKYKWSNGTLKERTLISDKEKNALLKLKHESITNRENARVLSLFYDTDPFLKLDPSR